MRFRDLPHRLLVPLALATLVATPVQAKTIRVTAGGSDANEKLQEALILAQPGDVVDPAVLDVAVRTLTRTQLFADVQLGVQLVKFSLQEMSRSDISGVWQSESH